MADVESFNGVVWESSSPGVDFRQFLILIGFLDELDPKSAREQLDAGYAPHGGWIPFHGFVMTADARLLYEGDPPLPWMLRATLREETVYVYEYGWVAVVNESDDTFEVARMD